MTRANALSLSVRAPVPKLGTGCKQLFILVFFAMACSRGPQVSQRLTAGELGPTVSGAQAMQGDQAPGKTGAGAAMAGADAGASQEGTLVQGEIRVERQGDTGPQFRVEVAQTDAERSRGLMFRKSLADDRGMIFLMPGDDDWSFWMKNTYIHLDMVFIDQQWRVVGMLEDVPPLTLDARSVGAQSRYVLELAAHVARHSGIKTGTVLRFTPPQALDPKQGGGGLR